MPSQRRLIVNADDFGLHKSINEAIYQAHLKGLVTSTSLMPGPHVAPAFDHALNMLSQMPDLDVGLHFTLVGAPGLPDNYIAFLQAKLMGDFPSSSIETTLRAQLEILLEKGIAVSHIDSHQHLHALPSIMRIVAKVAAEYRIPAVRLPAELGSMPGASKKRKLLAKALALVCSRSKTELDQAGVHYTDHVAGMAITGSLTSAVMVDMLKGLLPGVTEILCHPGASNAALRSEIDWDCDWQGELNAVTSRAVLDCYRDEGISRMTFRELAS